jgi:hypothetical protein
LLGFATEVLVVLLFWVANRSFDPAASGVTTESPATITLFQMSTISYDLANQLADLPSNSTGYPCQMFISIFTKDEVNKQLNSNVMDFINFIATNRQTRDKCNIFAFWRCRLD